MAEFKFDKGDLDDNAVRLMGMMAPMLAEENPAHVLAALTLAVASYITLLTSMAEMDKEDVDQMIDGMIGKIRRTTHVQRAYYHQKMTNPGNA